MGCDIDLRTMRRDGDRLVEVDVVFAEGEKEPYVFPYRNYALCGFLANVYNRDGIQTIAPTRGNPPEMGPIKTYDEAMRDGDDCDSWEWPGACSWLSIDELEDFDYDQKYERSVGGSRTIREALGPRYFEDLGRMRRSGVDVIVFRFNC